MSYSAAETHANCVKGFFGDISRKCASRLSSTAQRARRRSSSSGRKISASIPFYEKLAKDYEKSVRGKEAKERLQVLKDNGKEIEEFYAKMNELAADPKTP